jgi:hypothetical protein
MFKLAIIASTKSTAIAETQRAPSNETAIVTVTVTLSPKTDPFY